MLDFYSRNGYKVETDGEMITILDGNGVEQGSYHPRYGSSIKGIRSPVKTLEIMEAIEDGRRLLSGGGN